MLKDIYPLPVCEHTSKQPAVSGAWDHSKKERLYISSILVVKCCHTDDWLFTVTAYYSSGIIFQL